jgi:hypothetical protein
MTVYHHQSANVKLNSFKINLVDTITGYQYGYSVPPKPVKLNIYKFYTFINYNIKNFISGSVGFGQSME